MDLRSSRLDMLSGAIQMALGVRLVSHIISAWNYFQILTLWLYHISTPTPHSSMDFHLSPFNHHQTVFIAQSLINMSNPDDLKSIFEDPSDIEMDNLSKPNHTLNLKQFL